MAEYKDPENTLVIETSKGPVVIELRPDLAPKHVDRIKTLARENFMTASCFIASFPVSWRRRDVRKGAVRAVLRTKICRPSSMPSRTCAASARWRARANPNSANSQFFICFDDATFLDKQYTVWGKVIEGMENVDKINKGEPPENPDKMITVRVAADVA